MKRMHAAMIVISLVLGSILNHVVVASATMPVPTSVSFYKYDAGATPFLADDPASAKPLGIGSLAEGGDVFSLQVGLNPWAGPVDIYLGVQILPLGPEIYLFLQDGSLKPLSEVGLLPWKTEATDPISETLLGGNIPATALPAGVYRLFLGVSPKGSMNAMDLWQADFHVGQWNEQQIEYKIMASFGEDGGFSAIVLAADQGYSVTQIVCAAMTGRLTTTGAITTYPGLPEPSEYVASNMLIAGPQVMAQMTGTKISVSVLLEEAKKNRVSASDQIFALVLLLLEDGYSPEQVFEGIFLGKVISEQVVFDDQYDKRELGFDIYIADDQGQRLVPDLSPSQIVRSLKVSLVGDTSLELVAGQAKGSWRGSIDAKPTDGCTWETWYVMNFGEGWVGPAFQTYSSFTVEHTFTKPGIYEVYAKVSSYCKMSGERSTRERVSNTVVVEVKEPDSDFPYTSVAIELKWEDPGILLALGAVQGTISNLYVPEWNEPTIYYDMPNTPGVARVIPSESGEYIVVVWVYGIPVGLEEPVDVPFTLTVDTTPYAISPDGKLSFGEKVSSKYSDLVTTKPYDPTEEGIFAFGGPVPVAVVVVNKAPPQ